MKNSVRNQVVLIYKGGKPDSDLFVTNLDQVAQVALETLAESSESVYTALLTELRDSY